MTSAGAGPPAAGTAPRQTPRHPGVTFRALVLAVVLIVANAVWLSYCIIFEQSHPTTVSLFYNAVFTLLVLCVANLALRKWAPRLALHRGELLVIYSLVSVASALCGLDYMQVLIPVIAHPFHFATPENGWDQLFLKYIPHWLAVTNTGALDRLQDGHTTFFTRANLAAWWQPMLAWIGFFVVMLFVMLCINSLVRKQWTEEAKLSFPIIQLPLDLSEPRGSLFRSRAMWMGFGLAALYDGLNGLHRLYPQVPNLGGELYDLGQAIRSAPWTAIGWTPLAVFPFAVGLAFFIPLDLAFSCWFFYLFWKAERVLSSAAGWGNVPSAPFINEQSFAAYIGLAAFGLWTTRHHLASIFRAAVRGETAGKAEPIPYGAALFGVVAGIAALTAFSSKAGASWISSAVFFVLYFGITTAVARIRAELGSPVHDLHFSGPDLVMVDAVGTRALGKPTLTIFAFFFSFNRAHRGDPMPHQLEAMKLAEQTRTSYRRLAYALMLAAFLGMSVGFVAQNDAYYRYGLGGSSWKGHEAFSLLESRLVSPTPTNWYACLAMAFGLAFTLLLTAVRARSVWWPFHPAGFAVSGTWSMALLCPSIFVSWLIKAVLMRYAGLTSYRPATTFFCGLILGSFVAGTFWSLLGIFTKQPMYNFLP
jgi:hypothetical protein